ncbi:titin [Episyrphus balteatus]|uniref:titin n=1 Tax=Episyrphus balteatus TaxID=286459 RepID=UPI002485B115|nr:titin [Episyrphus balteatus]
METPKNTNQSSPPPLLTPKSASGPQRVIKQIMVIDPTKLRLTGLDVKMAEALKKSKPSKTQSKSISKESKLEFAKSLLNKKLKDAMKKKESTKDSQSSTSSLSSSQTNPKNTLNNIEMAAQKLSSSKSEKKGSRGKPKISVATLKSLMPPPSLPTSSPNQTVEIKVLNSKQTKQSIEFKIVDSSKESPQKLAKFPKASLKTTKTQVSHETAAITSEINFEVRKKTIIENISDPKVSISESGKPSEAPVECGEENKASSPIKASFQEKEISEPVHGVSQVNEVPPILNEPIEVEYVNLNPDSVEQKDQLLTAQEVEYLNSNSLGPQEESLIPQKVEYLNSNSVGLQEESLIPQKVEYSLRPPEESLIPQESSLVEMTPIHSESLPYTKSELPIKSVTTSTPIRRVSLAQVIESKVLSPDEKIDLSLLTKKPPVVGLTVPKKRYKLDQNWITPEPNQEESTIYLNLSPVTKGKPVAPVVEQPQVVEESAVDFINNLSFFFAESQKSKSNAPALPDSLTKECSEDATSFLVSLFQKNQGNSLEVQKSTKEKDEDSEALESSCITNNDQSSEQESSLKTPLNTTTKIASSLKNPLDTINTPKSSSKTPMNTTDSQVPELDKKDLSNKEENKTEKEQKVVKTPTQSLNDSHVATNSNTEKISIEDIKSITSNLENEKQSIASIEPIEPPSDLVKTDSNTTLLAEKEESKLPNVSLNTTLPIPSATEEKSTPKSSLPSISSRRKTNKPIPVLIPKLKKSRKPSTLAQKPEPEEPKELLVPQKSIEQPVNESPTQPVQNIKELNNDVVSIDSTTPLQIKEDQPKKEEQSSDQITQITSQKSPRKRRDTPKSGIFEPTPVSTLPSPLTLTDSVEISEELPSTSSSIGRPQRQRKISLKLIESSEFLPTVTSAFQGIVNSTVDKAFKEKKDSPSTNTDKPQRQRKVSFKLLETTDQHQADIKSTNQGQDNVKEQKSTEKVDLASTTGKVQRRRRTSSKLLETTPEPTTTLKPATQSLDNSIEQEVKKTLPTPTTDRPQRTKRMSFKLMESSETLSLALKSQKHSVDQETKDKLDKTESPRSTKNEMKEAVNDPIAQLVAFHETVEKFELACGSLKSKRIQDIAINAEGEGNSLSEYPFHDAICKSSESTISATTDDTTVDSVQTNQTIQEEKNVEQIPTKILRKRKDSLKSRNIASDHISIVSSDSEDTPICKLKKTSPIIKQSEIKEASETDSKPTENEKESKKVLNDSSFLQNPNVTTESVDTPTIVKKRRGRPPKVKKEFPKAEVVENAVEPEPQPTATITRANSHLRGSWETLTSTDEPDVKVLDKPVSKRGRKKGWNSKLNTSKNKDLDETLNNKDIVEVPDKSISLVLNTSCGKALPSTDEQDVTIIDKPVSKRGRKKRVNSMLNTSIKKDLDETLDNKDIVEVLDRNISLDLNTSHAEEKDEQTSTPIVPRKRGRPPKVRKIVPEEQPSTSKTKNIIEKVASKKEESDKAVEAEVAKEDHVASKDPTTEEPSNSPDPTAPNIIQTTSNKKQDVQKDGSVQLSIGVEISESGSSELGTAESAINETQKIPETSLVVEIEYHKSPVKSVKVNDQEVISQKVEQKGLTSIESNKNSEPTGSDISSVDSIEPCQVENQIAGQELMPKVDHSNLAEISESNISEQECSKSVSTADENLFDNLKSSETLKAASSKLRSDESDLNKNNDDSLSNVNEPIKTIPHFEDVTFDLDNIESPSFSPICERSRISEDDSDGFEDIDENFTSAIIDTVAEAEKSVDVSKMSKEGLDNLKQSSSFNSESSPTKKLKTSESLKEDSKYSSDKESSLVSEKKSAESSKHIDEPTSNDVKETSLVIVEEDPKHVNDESPSLSSSITTKTADSMKQLACEKSGESCKTNALVLVDKSSDSLSLISSGTTSTPEKVKPIEEEPTSDKKKQSSALYSAVVNKSEEKTKITKAKNPFKKQSLKEKDKDTDTKSPVDFLGFDAEEIEEGQQSTSLRLSQSEDAETLSIIESPSIVNIKPKQKIRKESQDNSGTKVKKEKQKWEKKSANTLINWLSNPAKGGAAATSDDVCDTKEDANEQSSSVPPKKRRTKVQNLDESITLTKHVEHHNNEAISHEVDLVLKKEKGKKGRTPKLKKHTKLEESLCETITSPKLEESFCQNITSTSKDLNLSTKPFSTKSMKVAEETTSKDETPKRGKKKAGQPNIVPDEFVNVVLKTTSVRTPKGRSRKRKRSESEECTTEPPTKLPHLGADLLLTDLYSCQPKRKAGRPAKRTSCDSTQISIDTASPFTDPPLPKRKFKTDCEFNPRLLLIRKREELNSDEPIVDPNLQTERKSPDDVQCALCMGYTPKKKWIQHVSNHYGIGWIVGQPPPLNVKSRASVLSFLIEFFKVSKIKGLNCRLCNTLRRSGLGLLMHLEQCCLTKEELDKNRIVCEYCKKNYSKASFLGHQRTCSEYLKYVLAQSSLENTEKSEDVPNIDVLSNTGRLKRKSVIKAETKLKSLTEPPEFVPDDFIEYIPKEITPDIEIIKENWRLEINSLGKGFCANKKCHFTATSVEELVAHYDVNICKQFTKTGYVCLKCKFKYDFHHDDIEVVRRHVVASHSPKVPKAKDDIEAEINSSESSDSISSGEEEVDSDEGADSDAEKGGEDGEKKSKPKKKSKKKKLKRFSLKNPPTKEYRKLLPERNSKIKNVVIDHYDKFIKSNYSLDPLFTFATTNVTYTEASDSYFAKSTESIKFIHDGFNGFVKTFGEIKIEKDQWKQLERLHGLTHKSEYTIYMGGPVTSLAWVPLDPHPPSNTQYLAVTIRKGLDKFARFKNQKRSRTLIYILKFDLIESSEVKGAISYAVAIDDGPIHAIEFLPSGGYSPEMNRLGMIAVGTAETEIKIYSLPLYVEKNDCDLFPIVRLEAAMELHLDVSANPSDDMDNYMTQCTCLVWSKFAGHNFIVGGFVNGFIGIWDISDDVDNLNRFNRNGTRIFCPVSFFWTSEDRLMSLVMHYDVNGPRWLAACNSTRKIMLYDLRDITEPVLFRIEVTINVITCLEWPVIWENFFYGLGDMMPSNGCIISAFSPMTILYNNRRFEKFCTGVTDIHYNIWKNSFVGGADNGDIQVAPLREGVLDVAQRLKIDVKTISTLDIVSLTDDKEINALPEEGQRVFDNEAMGQYGIVFGSIRKLPGRKKPEYYEPKRIPPVNLQRLVRINKIRYNHNKNACDVLAMGYNNGLLRVDIRDWLMEGQN